MYRRPRAKDRGRMLRRGDEKVAKERETCREGYALRPSVDRIHDRLHQQDDGPGRNRCGGNDQRHDTPPEIIITH